MRTFEVVGDEVLGEIMGEEELGVDPPRGGHPGGHRLIKVAPKPGWRSQLAPGVIHPDEGMVPLPLVGSGGTNTFSATLQTITFQGQLQKPYRAERLLVSTVRTGASAVGRLLTLPFVGTDLQLADINGIDIELVGANTAFGTRLTLKAAEPGVFIRLQSTLSVALTGTDTIIASMMFLGRVIH